MIDLIIPLYNAEDTIEQLLGSICAQTKKHGTMITFVNDHCTDKTIEIIKKWKGIIHYPTRIITPPIKLNYPGLVRQYGLDRTKCDYVMFCDDDDELLPQAFEQLSLLIRTTNADMVMTSFITEHDDHNEKIYKSDDGLLTWNHGKIYRRTFLEKNNIRFPGGYNEDGAFNLQCALWSNNIFISEKSTYLWCNNKQSITRSEENWLLNHLDDVINNYTNVYKDFFKTNKNIFTFNNQVLDTDMLEGRYWTHTLSHLKLFYQWINLYKLMNADTNQIEHIYKLVKNFVKETQLIQFLNNEISDIIKEQLVKDTNKELTYVTLNDFLQQLNIYIDLRPNKIIKERGGCLV